MKDFKNKVKEFVKEKISKKLIADEFVVIKSLPGCQHQAPHFDYDPKRFKDIKNEDVPCGLIIALMDNTMLTVWRKAFAIHDLDKEQKFHPKIYKLNKEDCLVFRGDTVHAGSAYEKGNIRIHCYLDSDKVMREFNHTWTTETIDEVRDIIVPVSVNKKKRVRFMQ